MELHRSNTGLIGICLILLLRFLFEIGSALTEKRHISTWSDLFMTNQGCGQTRPQNKNLFSIIYKALYMSK